MQLNTFASLVSAFVRNQGAQFLEGDQTIAAVVISTRLREFSCAAQCLWSDRIKFTPTSGQAVYDLENAAALVVFGNTFKWDGVGDGSYTTPVGMVDIEQVMVSGTYLLDPDGAPGPYDFDELRAVTPSYITDADSTPNRFATRKGQLVLSPGPDAAGAALTCYVQGSFQHPALGSSTTGTEAILIPERLCWLAAEYCAIALESVYLNFADRVAANARGEFILAKAREEKVNQHRSFISAGRGRTSGKTNITSLGS
jgi:hypothetical protein